MAFTNRTFGVEIEFVGRRAAAISALRDAGIEVYDSSYTHQVSSRWKVVPDGSVSNGAELVSPVLSGEEGLRQVKVAAKALREAGCTVNRSCGLHVHVGASDLSVKELAHVVDRYASHEAALDAVMPNSRRHNNNTYCRSLLGGYVNLDRLKNSTSVRDLESSMNHARYYKVNLMAYARQQTVEFRQHSGSLSGEKITNWVRFCVNFVEMSRFVSTTTTASGTATTRTRAPRRRRQNTKRARLLAMLVDRGRDGYYATHLAHELDVTDNTLRTMVSNLRGEGYGIRYSRSWGKFYLTSQPTTVATEPAPVFLQVPPPAAPRTTVGPQTDRGPWHGLAATTISYFEERTMELAGI